MDTEAIASEIVSIRHRLDELENESDSRDVADEHKELRDRLRHLQDLVSEKTDREGTQDSPAEPDSIHYHPPA